MNGLFSQNGLGGFPQGLGLAALLGGTGYPNYAYGQQQAMTNQQRAIMAQQQCTQSPFNPLFQGMRLPKQVESHELTPWEVGCKQIDDAVQAVKDAQNKAKL